MTSVPLRLDLLANVRDNVAIVTGAAGGIGAETVRVLHANGAKVVLADLPASRNAAQDVIASLSDPNRAHFMPANILKWDEMKALFKAAIERFGRVDIVVANAGLMESKPFFEFETDETGDLREPTESYRVIDVNLKGTMNSAFLPLWLSSSLTNTHTALRLAMFYMKSNPVDPITQSRGSVILVASTSGYFGGTGVVSYISSKHGVVGLLRASQKAAARYEIRVNAVAPFFTPTYITGSYSEKWKEKGLPANTTTDVANAIVSVKRSLYAQALNIPSGADSRRPKFEG